MVLGESQKVSKLDRGEGVVTKGYPWSLLFLAMTLFADLANYILPVELLVELWSYQASPLIVSTLWTTLVVWINSILYSCTIRAQTGYLTHKLRKYEMDPFFYVCCFQQKNISDFLKLQFWEIWGFSLNKIFFYPRPHLVLSDCVRRFLASGRGHF